MRSREHAGHIPPEEAFPPAAEYPTTDEGLRRKVDALVGVFCNDFSVAGKDALLAAQERDPDAKFVIAASHISNLDAPAAVKALGDRLDIQITTESILHGFTPQEFFLFRPAGKEHFSTLEYRQGKGGKHGVFNPGDFTELAQQMQRGKTPWMAVHPFTVKEAMEPAGIGSVYLAQRTGAKILPTALELRGDSVNLEGIGELLKGVASRWRGEASATYHVGEPIDLPALDVSVIAAVLDKRARREKVSPDERRQFHEVHEQLRQQADLVAEKIAQLLPEDQRGAYRAPTPEA